MCSWPTSSVITLMQVRALGQGPGRIRGVSGVHDASLRRSSECLSPFFFCSCTPSPGSTSLPARSSFDCGGKRVPDLLIIAPELRGVDRDIGCRRLVRPREARMAKKSYVAFFWALFSAGGVTAAFLLPVHVFLFGLAFPLGWIEPPSYESLLGLLQSPVTRLLPSRPLASCRCFTGLTDFATRCTTAHRSSI